MGGQHGRILAYLATTACISFGLLLNPATADAPSSQPELARAFASLCVSGGISAQSVLAHADKDGWRREGAHLPEDFNPAEDRVKDTAQGLLRLKVASAPTPGGHMNGCTISAEFESPGILAAVQTVLGFRPAMNFGASGTFFAEWSGNAWHSAATFTHADTVAARTEGRFFSIAVGSEPTSSSIMMIQPILDAHN